MNLKLNQLALLLFSLILVNSCKKSPVYPGKYPLPVVIKKYKLEILSVELLKYPYFNGMWTDTEVNQDVYLTYGVDWFEVDSQTQHNFYQKKVNMLETDIPYKFNLSQAFVDTLSYTEPPKNFRLTVNVHDDDSPASAPSFYWDYNDPLMYLYLPAVFRLGTNKVITEAEEAYIEYRLTEIQ